VVRDAAAESGCAVPGSLMAAVAIRISGGQIVVVPGMAIGASIHFSRGSELVRTCQRPAGRGMVEDHVRPKRGVMTSGAISGGKRRAGT